MSVIERPTPTPIELVGFEPIHLAEELSPSEIIEDDRTVIPVVRIFPVCHRPVGAIAADIATLKGSGASLSELDFMHIPLMRKSSDSTVSHGQLIPIGGKIEPGESLAQAAIRELEEETTSINPINRWSRDEVTQCTTDTATGYVYTILRQDASGEYREYKPGTVNRAYSVVIDASNLQGREPDILQPSIDKAQGIEFYTTSSLEVLLEGSDPNGFVGGARKGESADTFADEHETEIKNAVIDQTVAAIRQREVSFHERLIALINKSRVQFGNNNHIAALDDVEQVGEILEAYETLRRADLMQQFRTEERDRLALRSAVEGVGTPTNRVAYLRKDLGALLGKDVLYYAQLFADLDIAQLGAISAQTTTSVVKTLNYLKRTLRDSFLAMDGKYNYREHWEKSMPGAHVKQNSREQKRWTQFMLASLQHEYAHYDFEQQQYFDRTLSESVEARLCEDFDVTPEQLTFIHQSAIRLADQTIDQEATKAHPDIAAAQWHDLLNDVRNANIGQLMLISLGITQYPDMDDETLRLYRFEASKCLALLLKGLSIHDVWQERKLRSDKFFADLTGRIFGRPVDVRNIQVTLPDGRPQNRELSIRQSSRYGRVIIDNVPPKDFESFLRKSLEEPAAMIRDVTRYNIGLIDDEEAERLKTEDFAAYTAYQIQRARNLVNDLVGDEDEGIPGFVQETVGPSYAVSVADRRDYYEAFESHMNQPPEDERIEIREGERTASKGGRIVREKLILIVQGQTEKGRDFAAHCELACYPFLKLDNDFLALIDKIADTDYFFERLTAPLTHYNPQTDKGERLVGYPSLYGLLHPPHLYYQSPEVLRSRLSKRQSTTESDEDVEEGVVWATPIRPNGRGLKHKVMRARKRRGM